MHFTDQDLGLPIEGSLMETTVTARRGSGRLLEAAIVIRSEEVGDAGAAGWTRQLGMALGMDTSSDFDSVMERGRFVDPLSDGSAGASDITTLCTMYGDPPLCEDIDPLM